MGLHPAERVREYRAAGYWTDDMIDALLRERVAVHGDVRAIVDPLIRPKPKIKFLVEANGSNTFWIARRQLLFSLPDWPMSLHVSGPQGSHIITKETW